MSLASSDYGDTASTSSRTGTSTGSYGSSSGSGATDYYDADVRASAAISGSTASSTATDFSSQLIKTTESHWSVSGTSVIAAWGACLVGGIIIILLFSRYRTRKPLIFLPRYRQLVAKELLVHKLRRKGNYHALIPSSDPKKDLEKDELEYELVDAGCGTGSANKGQEGVKGNGTGSSKVRLKHAEEAAPFFGWLRPAWHDFRVELVFWWADRAKQRDERILKTLGLDAFTMLEFLRLFRWLFALISVFVAIPLLCANYFINTRTEYGSTSLTVDSGNNGTASSGLQLNNMTSVIGDLQLYTAANIKGDGLWVHVMADFAVTLLVVLQVRIYARRHDRAIEQWSDMNQNEVSFRTIMITRLEISRKNTIAQAKDRIRSKLKLGPKEQDCLIDLKQENMGPFYERFEFWNKTEHPRAAAAAQRIVDLQKRAVQAVKRRLKREEEDGSEDEDNVDDKGKKGRGGKSVPRQGEGKGKEEDDEGEADVQGGCAWWNMDALKSDYDILRESIGVFKAARVNQTQLRRQEEGGLLVADVTAAFVTWRTAREAHTVLQRLVKANNPNFKVERTPRNNCVIWRNLEKDPATLWTHRITGRILRVLITVVNSLPLLFITVLANLDALTRRWPRLQTLRESSKFWEAVFTAAAGILPAGLAALFVLALPHLMRFLSHWQGALSRGQMDQDVIKQMFLFMLVSKFVVFSLLGVGYETYLSVADKFGKESAQEIFASLGDVPAKVTRAYIAQSSYWLSFFPIRSALTCLNLLQPVRWLMKFWEIYITREANTRDRIDEVAEPPEFELFGMVVALVYTPLAPLIALCGTLYFWIASVVIQNQLTYVEKTIETDGKAWRVVMNRLLAGLGCMQGLMILTVLLKTNPFSPDSTVSLGVRLAPLIISLLPPALTFHLARHVRNKRGAAEIISSRSAMLDSPDEASLLAARRAQLEGDIPRFEHEILNKGSLKTVSIFDFDLPLLAAGLNRARGSFTLKGGKLQGAWPDHVYWDARRLIPQYGRYMAEMEKSEEQRAAEAEQKKRKAAKRKVREEREREREREKERRKRKRLKEAERREAERKREGEERKRREKRERERRELRKLEERLGEGSDRRRERERERGGARGRKDNDRRCR